MKFFKLFPLMVGLVILLCGMGNLGGGPEGTVPKTDEDIRVKLTDNSGVVTELTQFSLDGVTALSGTRGSAQVTIMLRNIAAAEFLAGSDKDNVVVTVSLREGGDVQVKLGSRLLFYGSTGYGAFQIKARDIKRFEVIPPQ